MSTRIDREVICRLLRFEEVELPATGAAVTYGFKNAHVKRFESRDEAWQFYQELVDLVTEAVEMVEMSREGMDAAGRMADWLEEHDRASVADYIRAQFGIEVNKDDEDEGFSGAMTFIGS